MKKVILSLSLVLAVFVFFSCSGSGGKNETDKAEKSVQIAEASLTVHGACGMCKTRIEKTANGIEGVSEAAWDKETNNLKFKLESDVEVMEVHKLLASVGHDTDKITAPDDVYNALPGCCHYRTVETH
ncbi:heavy-metal-associated domain-containing protein [Bacteroidota bacterium]